MSKERRIPERPFYVFAGPGITQLITLPDGFRFVCFVRDMSPSAIPIDEPGRYEMSPDLLPGGSWPIAITTCLLKHVAILEAIPSDKVNAVLSVVTGDRERLQ